MTEFPSNHEPKQFTSALESAHKHWHKWAALAVAIIPMFIGGILNWPKWIVIATGAGFYFFVLLLLSRINKPRSSKPEDLSEKPPLPELLIARWRKILALANDAPATWVLFSHGTCVLFPKPPADPSSKAIELLKKWGPYEAGTSSADMIVTTLRDGLRFVVGGHHPEIFTYVEPESALLEAPSEHIAGLIGRYFRDVDARTLKVIHIENFRNP